MKRILIALIAVAFVTPVFAQEEPPPIVEASHNAVVVFLRLSPEQVEAWYVIYQIHREKEQPLQEKIAEVQVEIDALLDDLGRRGIQHLLVEGGAAVTGAFVTARRVDRVIAFMNPRFLGARGAVPWVDADAVASPAEGLAIRRTATMALGEDLVIMGDAISVDAGD